MNIESCKKKDIKEKVNVISGDPQFTKWRHSSLPKLFIQIVFSL